MKKFLFLLVSGMLFGTSVANAQYKPTEGSWSAELNYSLGDGVFKLHEYGARGRYFLNDNLAVRFTLGVVTDRNIETTYLKDSDNKDYEKNDNTFTNSFAIMPGIEYHFNKFERVSPYVGAEIGFEAGNAGKRSDNTLNNDYSLSKRPVFGFKLNLVTGVDVYICKGFYMGAELGLGYGYTNTGRGVSEIKNGNDVTTTDGSTSTSTHSFGFKANPSLRIGWNF